MIPGGDLLHEQWRPIPDRDGYQVSNLGRIRSLRGRRGYPVPHVMALHPNPRSGYLQVRFQPERKFYRVHPMVLSAFAGPRPEGLVIRHLNGVKTDNRRTNLAYGTVAENNADTIRHGGHFQAEQTHCINGHEFTVENTYINVGHRVCRACSRARYAERVGGLTVHLSDEVAVAAIRRFRNGEPQGTIAADLGISQSLISQWATGKSRPHLQERLARQDAAA